MRWSVSIFAAAVLVGGVARAGDFASVGALDATARTQLGKSISKARVDAPQTFDSVGSIVTHADELDHRKRGRFFPMAALLRSTVRGRQGAAMALLEPLVFSDRFTMPTSDTARIALRAGLIEAAGESKDLAAAPVYRTIIQSGTEAFEVRAAVEALGKIATDADVAMLASLVTTSGPKQLAAIGGIGGCRRIGAAHALEQVAAQHPQGGQARAVLSALGTIASAWALATPSAAPAAEIPALRATAGRAAFVIFLTAADADVRLAASNALMTIDAPETPSWIAGAKPGASADLQTALDALAVRLAHNPTR